MREVVPLVLLALLTVHYTIIGYREYREFDRFVSEELEGLEWPHWRKMMIGSIVVIVSLPIVYAGALFYGNELIA